MKLYIREMRQSKEISLNELSKITGISKSYLSDLENEKRKNISVAKLCIIAQKLGVEITKLFNCEEE